MRSSSAGRRNASADTSPEDSQPRATRSGAAARGRAGAAARQGGRDEGFPNLVPARGPLQHEDQELLDEFLEAAAAPRAAARAAAAARSPAAARAASPAAARAASPAARSPAQQARRERAAPQPAAAAAPQAPAAPAAAAVPPPPPPPAGRAPKLGPGGRPVQEKVALDLELLPELAWWEVNRDDLNALLKHVKTVFGPSKSRQQRNLENGYIQRDTSPECIAAIDWAILKYLPLAGWLAATTEATVYVWEIVQLLGWPSVFSRSRTVTNPITHVETTLTHFRTTLNLKDRYTVLASTHLRRLNVPGVPEGAQLHTYPWVPVLLPSTLYERFKADEAKDVDDMPYEDEPEREVAYRVERMALARWKAPPYLRTVDPALLADGTAFLSGVGRFQVVQAPGAPRPGIPAGAAAAPARLQAIIAARGIGAAGAGGAGAGGAGGAAAAPAASAAAAPAAGGGAVRGFLAMQRLREAMLGAPANQQAPPVILGVAPEVVAALAEADAWLGGGEPLPEAVAAAAAQAQPAAAAADHAAGAPPRAPQAPQPRLPLPQLLLPPPPPVKHQFLVYFTDFPGGGEEHSLRCNFSSASTGTRVLKALQSNRLFKVAMGEATGYELKIEPPAPLPHRDGLYSWQLGAESFASLLPFALPPVSPPNTTLFDVRVRFLGADEMAMRGGYGPEAAAAAAARAPAPAPVPAPAPAAAQDVLSPRSAVQEAMAAAVGTVHAAAAGGRSPRKAEASQAAAAAAASEESQPAGAAALAALASELEATQPSFGRLPVAAGRARGLAARAAPHDEDTEDGSSSAARRVARRDGHVRWGSGNRQRDGHDVEEEEDDEGFGTQAATQAVHLPMASLSDGEEDDSEEEEEDEESSSSSSSDDDGGRRRPRTRNSVSSRTRRSSRVGAASPSPSRLGIGAKRPRRSPAAVAPPGRVVSGASGTATASSQSTDAGVIGRRTRSQGPVPDEAARPAKRRRT